MTIVYILGQYPSYSEYFISNEIKEVRKQGIDIIVLSLRRGLVLNDSSPANEEVIYDKSFFSFEKLLSHFYSIIFNRKPYFKALSSIIFTDGASIFTTAKEIRNFSTAVYFLYRLRRTSFNLLHAHFVSLPASIALIMSGLSGFSFSCSAHAHDIYTSNKEELVKKLNKARFIIT